MKSIVLASANPGKVREFSQLLAGCDLEIIPQTHFLVSSVEETGLSFVENAIIKARHASQQTGLPAISDDSGIEVDALNGAPGIYSARFAGVGATDEANLQQLLDQLREVPEGRRTARYHCVIVYMHHPKDPMPLICQGTWEGHILRERRGHYGFGYDPIFYVPTHHCTSAELLPDIKNQLSHRGQALRALQIALQAMS
jgi:XTP/dITP diphosphohydrolase